MNTIDAKEMKTGFYEMNPTETQPSFNKQDIDLSFSVIIFLR